MTAYKVSSQIDGTSALKINHDSVRFTVLRVLPANQDIQECSSFLSVDGVEDTQLKEDSFFVDDLRMIFKASGLADIASDVKQGSAAGMSCSLSPRGVVGIMLVTFFVALLMIV